MDSYFAKACSLPSNEGQHPFQRYLFAHAVPLMHQDSYLLEAGAAGYAVKTAPGCFLAFNPTTLRADKKVKALGFLIGRAELPPIFPNEADAAFKQQFWDYGAVTT